MARPARIEKTYHRNSAPRRSKRLLEQVARNVIQHQHQHLPGKPDNKRHKPATKRSNDHLDEPDKATTFKRQRISPTSSIERLECPDNPSLERRALSWPSSNPEFDDPVAAALKQHQYSFLINSRDAERKLPIGYWVLEGTWPKSLFEPIMMMSPQLVRKKSLARLARKRSLEDGPSTGTSDTDNTTNNTTEELSRVAKSGPYKNPLYEVFLNKQGVYMKKHEKGISTNSRLWCKTLLESAQELPQDTLFSDDLWEGTLEDLHNQNEAMIIRDLGSLLVPSARALFRQGRITTASLVESVNLGWNSAVSVSKTRPQPDFSVGFSETAFTTEQREELETYFGDVAEDISQLRATYYMILPFLTCEVKSQKESLEVADRQNAHSMALAVRGSVALYRLAKREKEVHQEILAFSISHNDRTVRIYGHYPFIEGEETTYWRHPIAEFALASQDGRDRWATYTFVKNVYQLWASRHLTNLQSVVDSIRANRLEAEKGKTTAEDTGLTQKLSGTEIAPEGDEEGEFEVEGQSSIDRTTPATSLPPSTTSKKQKQ